MEQVLTSLYHISPSASCVASLYSLRDFHLFFIVTTNPIYSILCKFELDGSGIDKFELDGSRIPASFTLLKEDKKENVFL